MLCILFMEVSGGQLTKYISGEKTFATGCLMDNFIYFLNSIAGCGTTSFKKIPCKVPCTWCSGSSTALMSTVNSLVRFSQTPSEGMRVSLSISWWLLNTFLSIRFKFDSLSWAKIDCRSDSVRCVSNSVCTTHIFQYNHFRCGVRAKKFSKWKYPFRFYFTPSDACSKSWKGTKCLHLPLQEKA